MKDTALWQSILDWQSKNQIADMASILGLLISIIGFAFTLYGTFSSRGAAMRAELAAKSATRRIKLIDDLVDLTSAISTLEEIRRFQRTEDWHLLPDRYSSLKKALISIKSSNTHLSSQQQTRVQNVIATLQSVERTVEKSLAETKVPDTARINNLLARETDGLQEILIELKLVHADDSNAKAD